jgi:hypothetical protein
MIAGSNSPDDGEICQVEGSTVGPQSYVVESSERKRHCANSRVLDSVLTLPRRQSAWARTIPKWEPCPSRIEGLPSTYPQTVTVDGAKKSLRLILTHGGCVS